MQLYKIDLSYTTLTPYQVLRYKALYLGSMEINQNLRYLIGYLNFIERLDVLKDTRFIKHVD